MLSNLRKIFNVNVKLNRKAISEVTVLKVINFCELSEIYGL